MQKELYLVDNFLSFISLKFHATIIVLIKVTLK